MSEISKIPMFPLAIFPLPGELVPLHIFEPRYRQLLEDAETKDITFGIFFNHIVNTEKLGALVKLESVLKRYPSGESDIIVKCLDIFDMETLFRTFRDKLYPGGDVRLWNIDATPQVGDKLEEGFLEYLSMMNITRHEKEFNIFQVALELNLDFEDRLRFVKLDIEKKESFLTSRINYSKQLLTQAEKAKDVFHLN